MSNKPFTAVPITKLQKLPRHQRLRKIWKIFAEAEKRCVLLCSLSGGEIAKCIEILKLLRDDDAFSYEAKTAINTSLDDLQKSNEQNNPEEKAILRRAFNTIRHLLLAETGRNFADWDIVSPDGKLDTSKRKVFPGMMVYLDDIRSPFNIGSMFRTAESFGAEKIFLSPLCASQDHPHSARTAMGCIEILPYERVHGLPQGFPVFALETGGTPLEEFLFPKQGIMIAGSEELGVNPTLLQAADSSLGRVSIPCFGTKASLNVSVAFGITMRAWAKSLN